MFQNDYLMRQIEMMVQFIARTILKKDSAVFKILPDDYENITSENGELYLNLMEKLNKGKINEAENMIFEAINENPNNSLLEIALDFYSQLAQMPEEYLEENNFSRDEVRQGLEDIMRIYNIDILDGIDF